jgi:hypothetical protein
MPDGIHAVVDPMEPSARHSALDHSVCQPDFEQLRHGYDPVLPRSELRSREVQSVASVTDAPSPAAGGRFSTCAVDSLPDAGHAAMVRGRGARINASV